MGEGADDGTGVVVVLVVVSVGEGGGAILRLCRLPRDHFVRTDGDLISHNTPIDLVL
jgi:hypothetical protein